MTSKKTVLVVVAISLVACCGCGDTYHSLMQEEMALGNEAVDLMVKVVDEDSAKFVTEIEIKKLKSKFEVLDKRKERYLKDTGINELVSMIEAVDKGVEGKGRTFKAGLLRGRVQSIGGQTQATATIEGKLIGDIYALQNRDYLVEFEAIKKRAREQRIRIRKIVDQLVEEEEGAAPQDYPFLNGFIGSESNVFLSVVNPDFGKTISLKDRDIDFKKKEDETTGYTILAVVALVLLLVGFIVYNLLKKMRII